MYNLNGENVNDNTSQTYSAPTPDNNSYQPYSGDTGDLGQQNYQQNTYTQGTYDQYNYNQQTYAGQTYASPTGNDGSTYNAAPTGYNPYAPNNQEKKPTPVFAVLGIIFALAAVISGWFIPGVGILFAIAGIVMGILAVGKRSSIRGLGIADIILSVCALVFLIVLIIVRTFSLIDEITTNKTLTYHDSLDNDFSFDFGDDDDDDYSFDDDYDDDSFYGWDDWTDDIDDVVMYSENGVVITATDLVYECYGDTVYPYVNVLIENNTDRNLYISVDYCSVNNIAMSSYFGEVINANKKMETQIPVDSSYFSACRFTEIQNIQLALDISDDDTGDYIVDGEEAPLINTTFADSYTPFDSDSLTNAEHIASTAGFDIYYLGVTEFIYDDEPCFLFYAENTSGHRAWVETDGFSVDDFMQSDYDIDTVENGNGTFLYLLCPDNLDDIQQAAVTFEVTYYDTMDVFYTDEVIFYQK